ncbi:hypothetical protein BBJ29_007925 [Phytophthora kernoviae]|uniref:BRCT domain-containing protein n=1 Tax=Phytophthora kernoviae TaxID=325452 RepID=A0A3R7HNZ1_9STRA|nr:hypothetical protein BBJ29_007925 [Phytophthora kernoviae]
MEQVRKIVLACGGNFQDDFDANKATHLIAEAVGSLKHRTAVAHELPVTSPRWVFESFRAQKLLDVKDFGLKVLEGLVVCTAGLPMEEKESVAELVTTHGAQYESRLESGFTNVLIAQRPEGAKYEAAIANDIPVVHVAWLHACLERQMLAEEEEFALRSEGESENLQPTHIAAKLRQDAQELVADLPQIVKRYRRSQREENVELKSQATDAEEDSDDDWMDLFDGCVLYLLGFSPQMKTMLHRLIRTGMGTIYDNMVVRQVTHVLVSASLSDQQTLETIQARVIHANAEGEVHFVSAQWLLDCVKCQHLEPEELYPVEFDVHVPETGTGNIDAAPSFGVGDVGVPRLPIEVVQLNPGSEANPISSVISEDLLENKDGENVLNEVKANLTPESKKKNKLFPGYAFLLLCRNPEDEFLIKPMLKGLRGLHGGAEALALASSDFPHVDPEQFAFVTHAVMCCGAVLDEQAALTMQQRCYYFSFLVARE